MKNCLNCAYFRFVGLDKICGHQDHHRKIKKPRSSCADYLWIEDKTGKAFKIPFEESFMMVKNGAKSYHFNEDNTSIICHRCGFESYHVGDISNKYCGNCRIFHEDF